MRLQVKKFIVVFSIILGGKGSYDLQKLEQTHQKYNLTVKDFRIFMQLIRKSMREAGVEIV